MDSLLELMLVLGSFQSMPLHFRTLKGYKLSLSNMLLTMLCLSQTGCLIIRTCQVLLLPSDKTSVDIHSEYEKIAVVMKYRSISLRTFQRQWHNLCPHIVITKPCTDLCQKCQEFACKISKSGNITEEEKELLLTEYNRHVQLAKEQRDYYRAQVKLSKHNYMDLSDALKQAGNLFNQRHESRIFVWAYFLMFTF